VSDSVVQPDERVAAGRQRAGFSLTEMIVALAIVVVALAVVTGVFTMTTRTARATVALGEVQEATRNFLLQLQRDLEGIDPTQSILVISGWTQAAALTQDELEAGQHYRVLIGDPALEDASAARFDPTPPPGYSDPRTDILMFFTNRAAVSQVPALQPVDAFQQALLDGARMSPLLVVYGHAALAHSPDGISWPVPGSEQHIVPPSGDGRDLSPIAALRWHLARRATIIEQYNPDDPPCADTVHFPIAPAAGFEIFSPVELDRIRLGRATLQCAGDSLPLDLRALLAAFGPVVAPNGSVTGRALFSPYGLQLRSTPPAGWWNAGTLRLVRALLYGNNNTVAEQNRHVATVIEDLPPALQSNLAVQMLPGCAWFQVEFLLPEDPRNAIDHPDAFQRDDMPRWVEVEPGETYVFVPDTPENRELVQQQVAPSGGAGPNVGPAPVQPIPGSRLESFAPINRNSADASPRNRRIRMWPYAIRVTVRVFDPLGRLDGPIVRSLVHRFD